MGYYYEDDDDDELNSVHKSFRGPVVLSIGLVSGAVLFILLIVLATNNTNSGRNNLKNSQMLNPSETPEVKTALDVANNYTDQYGNKDIEGLYKDHLLRSEDLDFWDMYDRDRTQIVVETPEPTEGEEGEEIEGEGEDEASPEPTDDDGLIDDVPLNNLDYTNLKSINDKMQYSINGNVVSRLGVEISEANGLVDFNQLKNSGVDFVMLKAGERGYETGRISGDSMLSTNLKAATDAGLKIGIFFSSRAITDEEAREEADYTIQEIASYTIDYPIAYLYEGETFASSRTDELEKEDLTNMAKVFMREVKRSGYDTILYGTENYILNDIEGEEILPDYEVWLNASDSLPDYPYQYTMWKYRSNVIIPGVEKVGSYIISFIDYSLR